MLLIDEEEEKKKREENVKRLFGTSDSTVSTDISSINFDEIYNKRLQDIQNLFGTDYRELNQQSVESTSGSKVTPSEMIITDTNPSDILKTNDELEAENNTKRRSSSGLRTSGRSSVDNMNITSQATVNPQNNNNGNNSISNFRIGQDTNIQTPSNASIASNEEAQNIRQVNDYNDYLADKEAESDEWEFFKGGAFEDGYQFGDLTKTVVGSLADVAVNFVGGVISLPESIVDVGANIVATGQDLLGFDEAAQDTREWANTDYSEEFIKYMDKTFGYEDVSVFGHTTDDIFKTIGYVAAMAYGGNALASIGKTASVGSSALGASANLSNVSLSLAGHTLNLPTLSFFGGAASKLAETNAKGDSVTELERWGSAISGGTIEMITEGIFGLFGIGGNDITDDLVARVTGHIGSKFGKLAFKTGMQALGEGTEEILSYAGNYISDNYIIDKLGPTDFSSEWNWKDVLEQFGLAFASTLIMGGAGSAIQSNAAIKSAEEQLGRKLTQSEKAELTQKWISQEMVSNEVDYFNEENNVKDASDLNMVIVSNFENDGNISDLEATVGKYIENPNPNINVMPGIIRNKYNGGYNIVDVNTGIMLDNSYYKTVEDAQNGFNDKMINLDNASINNINNKIAQATIAIDNKMNEVASNISNENVANTSQSGTENVINDTQTGTNNVMNGANSGINNTNANEQIILSESFQNDINKFLSGKYSQKDAITVLDKLPDYFYNLGYETDKPLMLNMNKLETIMKEPKGNFDGKNQHGITMDIIEQIPQAINNPLNVIKNPNYRNRFVIITDLTDQYGDIILVPVEINNNAEITGINKITSIYGKETYDTPAKDNLKSYMEQNKDNIVYDIDNKNSISSNYRLQLPSKTRNTSTNSISQSDINMQAISKKTTTSKTENNNTDTYQTSQNQFTDGYINETTNYSSNSTNASTSQNNALNDVTRLLSQISDSSIYNRQQTRAIIENVSRNIPTIEIQQVDNTTYINSLDREGNVVRQQQVANRPYTGGEIRDLVNNAVYNADLSNINMAQASQNGFRGNPNNETVNYTIQNENENIEQNNTSNLSNEEIRNIVKYNQDGREISDENYVDFLVERYKDNKNISGVVTDTRYVESIENKSKKDKISDLYGKIKDKEFKITKKLKDESGKLQDLNMDLAITKTGLNESFNKGFSNEKYAVVPYLDELIKTASDGTVRSETKQRENILEWYYLYNTAEINKELYGVKIDIKKTGQGDRFYVHRVNLIKKEGSSNLMRTPLEMEKSLNTLPSINTSISQDTKNVKSNTNVNNKSMQNNKNNTQNQQKDIQKELHNRIQNALLSRNSRKNTFFGTVSDKVANKVKSLFGIDISGRKHMISDYDIRHIIKQHGNPVTEKIKGQIAVTTKDIEKIPDIINNYDNITKGTPNIDTLTKEQFNTIRYTKNYNDNTTYVVEIIPSNNKQLNIKTMWKKPITLTNSQKTPSSTSKTRGNSDSSTLKKESSRVNHGYHKAKTLHYTSETKPRLDSNKSIPQTSQNVKDNGIRAERTSNTAEYDNQGNRLTKAQRDFFKDSKVRDENGNLLVMYHGTDKTFYEFKNKKAQNGRAIIDGFYLTPTRSYASEYGDNVMEVYANLKNPLYLHNNNGLTRELIESGFAKNTEELIKKYDLETDDSGVVPTSKALTKLIKKLGFDGIITTTLDVDKIDSSYEYTQVVALKSAQIKNLTNTSPTSNPDIRYESANNTSQPYDARKYEKNTDFVNYLKDHNYLKDLMEVDNEQGATYAQSFERRIEQEIRQIESTGAFDNTIPVTKLSDINKMVEDFLGTKVTKGHFRQRVRGFYNTRTDKIRIKEYKDIDNVLHEMGHALDLGNRIKIDKESIANELLDAVKKHGGYDNENRSIQLDEGFAELVKEYAINPSQTKLDYPQTYSILETERQQNVEFNKFMSNLQSQIYNYIHQNPRNRVLSNQSIGEQTDKTPVTLNSMKENVVRWVWDRDYAIKEMTNGLANGAKLSPSQNVYLLTRLASGVNNKAISMISDGYIDLNGNRLMPGLNRLGEILGNDSQRWNDLRAFLVAKRDLEYKAKSLKTGIRTMDSKAVVEQFYNDAQIQEAAQVVYDTLDGVLQYAIDNGLINQETANSLRESNAFYVPFQRVIEGRGNQTGRRGAVADILNRRTGSELDIKDVLENIVANSANIIQQVENNNILRTLAEQGEAAGMKNNIFEEISPPMKKIGTEQLSTWEAELKKQGVDTSKLDLEKTIDLFVPNNKIITEKDGSHIVSYFDQDGSRKYLQFYKESTDIFNALMGMDKNANSTFLKIMRAANMPLRYGATMANVGFAIPNMISDTVQATIYSEAGFIPVVDNVLGILDVLGATNKSARNFLNKYAPEYAERINRLYDIYQQTGASSSTRMSQYRKSTQEIMRDIYGTKNSETLGIKESFKPLKRLMNLLTYIPELSESSTRFRVFERNYEAYKNKGGSELDARIKAAIESRDATQDFGRTGTVMREINQMIPFSAARVGSAYTFVEKVKANPKRIAARVAILATIAMAIKALGYDDDEIEELNQRKKDDNFVLKIGDTIVTIKKPQGILRSIINLVEYVQDLTTGNIEEGKEWDRLGEWLNNAIMDNMPADEPGGLVPNAIAPIVENFVNKDFYYNNDIVKSWDLDLPDSQQYYDYTSQLAIWLGSIFNYSPAKIDNLISGYFGSLGTQVTNVVDWISGKLGFSAEEPTMGAEDNAVGKRFVVNVNENSASVDEIYDREEELTKKLNGGTITEEENAELENIKSGISKLSAVNKQIKAIKQDLTMSGSEKADAIRPLQEQKTDIARQTLGKEPIYTENTDDLEALEFYPSRSTLSYNGLTLNLTEDMKTEYMNTAYALYKQYEKQGLYSTEYLEKLKDKIKDAAKKTIIQKYKNQLTKGG